MAKSRGGRENTIRGEGCERGCERNGDGRSSCHCHAPPRAKSFEENCIGDRWSGPASLCFPRLSIETPDAFTDRWCNVVCTMFGGAVQFSSLQPLGSFAPDSPPSSALPSPLTPPDWLGRLSLSRAHTVMRFGHIPPGYLSIFSGCQTFNSEHGWGSLNRFLHFWEVVPFYPPPLETCSKSAQGLYVSYEIVQKFGVSLRHRGDWRRDRKCLHLLTAICAYPPLLHTKSTQ